MGVGGCFPTACLSQCVCAPWFVLWSVASAMEGNTDQQPDRLAASRPSDTHHTHTQVHIRFPLPAVGGDK